MSLPRSSPALLLAMALCGAPSPAHALDADAARGRAEQAVRAVEADLGKIATAGADAERIRLTPAQRVARGEFHYRTKDYESATQMFAQVIELHRQGKASAAAAADATFLLGEVYFDTEQFLSARRQYREILDRVATRPFDTYAGRALGRLVDCALRSGRLEDLDDVMARLATLPTSDASGSLPYARAKAHYARGQLPEARAALGGVASTSPWALQAAYLAGAVVVKEIVAAPPPAEAPPPTPPGGAPPPAAGQAAAGAESVRWAPAIAQFRRVTQFPARTRAHKHVVDLAWMAVGRLSYEAGRYLEAAEAYSHVDRNSPEFHHMLYELAWVYVRLGDHQRALRALEVLAVIDPDTLELADGALLRADLMLRAGRFKQALELYESARDRFEPIHAQVVTFLGSTSDPGEYYDRLVEEYREGGEKTLSPLVVQWARAEAADDRVFSVVDDVARSRDLLERTRKLAQKLRAALVSPARVKAFPEVQAALQLTLGLTNRVAQARQTLAQGADDVASRASGELAQVRAERRALMDKLERLPVNPGDFERRNASGERQWNKVSQQLQRLGLEADRLQALINGMRRVLKDGQTYGANIGPAARQRYEAEIAAAERELAAYRKLIREYQDAVDMGRVQIGLGDQRTVDDDVARRRFRVVFSREVALMAAGADGSSAAAWARSVQPVLARADAVEDRLEGTRRYLDGEARQRADQLRQEVEREAANVERYAASLEALGTESRVVVGEVAMRAFALVRDRLRSVVLRADVGIVQEAWEVRETQRRRVRGLLRERSIEEQKLNDELREVLDDGEIQ